MKKKISLDISEFKIFDFHRHVSPINDFDANLKQYNIDKFCLMPTMLENDFNNISSYIGKIKPYYERYKKRAIIFGTLDFSRPPDDNLELLEKQKKEINIKGIKIHPDQGFEIDENYLKPYFDVISKTLGKKVPIYVHMDWSLIEENRYGPFSNKETFNKIVSFFPEYKFIMGHAGGSAQYLNVWKICKKYSNAYIETSMAPTTSPLEEVVWKVDPKRILFGSNYPYCGTNIELIKVLCLYKVSDADKKDILENNWEVLFSG